MVPGGKVVLIAPHGLTGVSALWSRHCLHRLWTAEQGSDPCLARKLRVRFYVRTMAVIAALRYCRASCWVFLIIVWRYAVGVMASQRLADGKRRGAGFVLCLSYADGPISTIRGACRSPALPQKVPFFATCDVAWLAPHAAVLDRTQRRERRGHRPRPRR